MARASDERLAKGEGGPLEGLPLAIKDLFCTEGIRTTACSRILDDFVPTYESTVTANLWRNGAVLIGKTNADEFAMGSSNETSCYGPVVSPWRRRGAPTKLVPGGSSGGSAAAVAAGIVPVAHGNDGMGSVRIPAACTGLVGIKPGSGVVPADLGENAWFGLTENGVLSTTVADAALVLSVMADDPTIAAASDAADGPELRIAVSTRPPVQGVKVDVEHVRALFRAAVDLMHDGHTVERHDPSYPPSVAIGALTRWFAGTALEVDGLDESLLEPRVRTHARIGRFVIDRGLVKDGARDAWIASSTELLTTYDVLMTPVLATPPIAAKRWGDTSWAATMMSNVPFAPFAAPWNLAGFPAMSVPAGIHPEHGTPLSVQLVARPGRERTLLAVARSMERLRPWPRTAPAYAD